MRLAKHLWVQSKTRDPGALFSTIPALGSQLFGVLAGRFLLNNLSRIEQTVWLLLAGLLFLWLGAIGS